MPEDFRRLIEQSSYSVTVCSDFFSTEYKGVRQNFVKERRVISVVR
jgi:hypothetical protein